MSQGIGVTDEPRFYQAVYTAVLDAMREHRSADGQSLRDELVQALAVMVEVFPPRSDTGPDAHAEQAAHELARAALAKARDREATA